MPDPDPGFRRIKEKAKTLDSRVRGNDDWERSFVMPDPDPASRNKKKSKTLDSRFRGNDEGGVCRNNEGRVVMRGHAGRTQRPFIRHAGPRSGIQKKKRKSKKTGSPIKNVGDDEWGLRGNDGKGEGMTNQGLRVDDD